jgi:hypothetical protein
MDKLRNRDMLELIDDSWFEDIKFKCFGYDFNFII